MDSANTHPHLDAQISALRTSGDWVNLKGLVSCALKYLSTQKDSGETDEPSILQCTSISLRGSGAYNFVYRLCFSNGLQLAARIPRRDEEAFSAAACLSEIATMKFVVESGLYPDIPVPKIHAWEVGFDNDAGAPWMLMNLVEGVSVDDDDDKVRGRGIDIWAFDVYPEDRQMAIVKALATMKAQLSKPVPFKEIGSIYFRKGAQNKRETTISQYQVGPMTTRSQQLYDEDSGGPYPSLAHMYTAFLQDHLSHALQHWCSLPTDSIRDPDRSLDLTPRTFSDIFHMLTSLIPQFTLPQSTSTFVLHHPEIALRNVLFDEASLKDGTPRITGVIDWAGTQILPLMLTAIYPGDLMSNNMTPFKPLYLQRKRRLETTYWETVPFDWTSTGNPSTEWPPCWWDGTGAKRTDHEPAIATQVRRFYLRTYFSACYASQMEEVYGNTDLTRASVFREAAYYLKFHKVMCSGPDDWKYYEDWIKETYWRLRLSGKSGGLVGDAMKKMGDGLPIIGPNVYHAKVEKPLRDLRMLEEEQDKWVRKFKTEADENKRDEEEANSESEGSKETES